MPEAPPLETSVHKSRVLRPAIAAIAAGLIASTLPAPAASGSSTIRHPGHQHTVAPVATEHPIHYPRSARSQPGRAPADQLLTEFFELHTAMAYEEAAVVAQRLVEITPARAEAHYNRACVMGRLRRADEAISSLERAVEHGWSDLVHLSIDPDLDSVRGTARYRALVEQLRRTHGGRVADPAGPWPARVNELQRSVPALLARDDVAAATITVVEDGLVVWSATFGSDPHDAGLTSTAGDLGRLLEALCDATRATNDRPASEWLDLAAQLGLDAWVDGGTDRVFLELSRPSVGGVLLLRWSPRLGQGVVVVTGGGDDGLTAGRIAALGVAAR